MATNKNIKIGLDYSEFVGGVTECQRKMQILSNEFKLQTARMGENATESDRLSLQSQKLSQQISLQEQIVQAAMAKWEAMADSEESTVAQVERAHIAYQKQATYLENLRNQLDKTNDSLDELENAEEDAADASEKSSEGFSMMASNITSVISVASSMIAALDQIRSMIWDLGTAATEWSDELATTATQIGVSTDTLQEWRYAAQFVDTDMNTLETSLNRLKRNMGEVEQGSATAAEKFDRLGVNVRGADGHLRSAEDVFYDCIDALNGMNNEAERDAAAMDILGKSATELNPLIEAGSAAFRAYGAEAQNLGLIMSSDEVSALNSMQDSFDRLTSVMDMAERKVSAAFAPALEKLANIIVSLDPAVLEGVAAISLVIKGVTTLVPLIQSIATVTTLSTAAKLTNTVATYAEAEGEMVLTAAATTANTALLPQIAIAAALMAALAALIWVIKQIIDLFTEEAEAADEAAVATERLTEASKGAQNSQGDSKNEGQSSNKHFALGGRVSGSKRVWVGETGPELVDLPSGSYVHDTQSSRQISNSYGGTNIVVNVDHISELNDLLRIQRQAQQRSRMGVQNT